MYPEDVQEGHASITRSMYTMNSCTRRANDWRQNKQNTEVESQETKLKYAIRLRTHGPRASEVTHRQDGGMGGGRRSSVILLAGGVATRRGKDSIQ
jgi:hypothetical protein